MRRPLRLSSATHGRRALLKRAKKDEEGYLDGFAACGVLTAFETRGQAWRAVGKVG